MRSATLRAGFLFGALLTAAPAQAYLTTLNTGEILPAGHYRMGADAQFVTGGDFSGGNFNGRFDLPLASDIEARAVAGFGKVDFHFGGYGKWIPIPDFENQPAMGAIAGFHYGRVNGVSALTLRVTPLVSKAFDAGSAGKLSPYVALPLGPTFIEKETVFAIQGVVGVEWAPEEMKHVRFQTEFGANMSKSFSYMAFSATLDFDSEEGVKFE